MAKIDLNKALFFDIETHRGVEWEQLTPAMQTAFINHYFDSETYRTPKDHYSEIAGLHAEFSHVICVVFGFINPATNQFTTFEAHGPDENKILDFCEKVFTGYGNGGYYLVGHNIYGCDIPYMVKRYIINHRPVPDFINSYGQKPWDMVHVDSQDLWKFGSWSRVSLEMICAALNIPCKTDEIGGKNLYTYDLDEMPWDQLVHYCTEDVVSNYQMVKTILDYYDTSD